jgi:hypothetical protein
MGRNFFRLMHEILNMGLAVSYKLQLYTYIHVCVQVIYPAFEAQAKIFADPYGAGLVALNAAKALGAGHMLMADGIVIPTDRARDLQPLPANNGPASLNAKTRAIQTELSNLPASLVPGAPCYDGFLDSRHTLRVLVRQFQKEYVPL